MSRVAPLCRYSLAVFFLLSAVLKALSFEEFAVQVSYYGVVRTPSIVRAMALGTIGLEAALGAGLLVARGGARGLLLSASALIVLFSALIAYAWGFQGLADCGCFGKYLRMTPGWSLLKNAVLLGFAAAAWGASGADAPGGAARKLFSWRSSVVAAAVALVLGIACLDASGGRGKTGGAKDADSQNSSTVGEREPAEELAATPPGSAQPSESRVDPSAGASAKGLFSTFVFEWEGERRDLAQGLHLVAMLSDSCEDCASLVESLNALAGNPDLPPLSGFVLGDDEASLRKFRETHKPRFPTQRMAPLEFLERIGKAPPRFILTKDGRQRRFWDEKPPDEIALLDAVLREM